MRQLRTAAGWSQAQVAAATGQDPSQISRVEKGERRLSATLAAFYEQQFHGSGLLLSLSEAAEDFESLRRRRRDPRLIAAQASYPLSGDACEFVGEDPPDGISVPLGHRFVKTWTIRNSGVVHWSGRRLMRIGPHVGPTILQSPRFVPIPDTAPGALASISVQLRAPKVQVVGQAKWKMVDDEDLLYFPDAYSVGLAALVLVGL
jgi:transcriptional regulator with XRE-family HTH domain